MTIIASVRVQVGQEWELPSAGSGDPLVLRVVQIMDDCASVLTSQRSSPKVVLNRSTMRLRDVIDTGVLVAGPGALDAARRRRRAAHLCDLIFYAARRSNSAVDERDIRVDAREIISLVAADEKVSRDIAKAMLRDALASLGGTETTSTPHWWSDPLSHEVYVIPVTALAKAA